MIEPLPQSPVEELPVVPEKHVSSRLKMAIPLILLFITLVGSAAVLVLVQRAQDNRNRAFTGYELTTAGGSQSVKATLKLAGPLDLPVNKSLEDDKTVKGLYFKLADLYQNQLPELQTIDDPTLKIKGQVFMKYDVRIGQTVLFARLENLPLAAGKVIRVWKSTKAGTYIPLTIGVVEPENTIPTTYAVYTGQGDLHEVAQDLIFSYDSSVQAPKPETVILAVHF